MHRAIKITAIAVLVLVALTSTAAPTAPSQSQATDGKAVQKTSSTGAMSQPDLLATQGMGKKLPAPEPTNAPDGEVKPSVLRLPSDVPRAVDPVEPSFGVAVRLPALAKSPPELPFSPDTRPIPIPQPSVTMAPAQEIAAVTKLVAPEELQGLTTRQPAANRPPEPSTQIAQQSPLRPARPRVMRLPAVAVSVKPSATEAPVKLVVPAQPVAHPIPTAQPNRPAAARVDQVAPPTPSDLKRVEVVSPTPNRGDINVGGSPNSTRPVDPIAIEAESVREPNPAIADPIPTISTRLTPPIGSADPHFWSAPQIQDRTILQEPRLFSHDDQMCNWNDSITWPCNTCGQTCCCCNQVCWRARTEALFLHRSRADGDAFIVGCNALGTGVRSEDLGMDVHGGPRFTLIRDNQSGGRDFEATYYSIDQWTGSDFHSGDLVVREVLGLGVGTGFVRYESRLQNAELNLTSDISNWTQFLIGFRWLQLDEFSSINASTAAFPNFYEDVDVVNDLYGGQLGLRRTLFDRGGHVTIDGWLKSGIYRNKIRRSTTGFGTSPLRKDETSWINELDFLANYEITSSWALNLGYQVMWIANIAEAPGQFFSPGAIASDETALLHGFRVGITFTH